ncbi:MAG: FAD-dependent oxidoreductase [Alphaproteobacteria bacterium]|nr:FAD-dependent oxidoreductase [Alphaproteobacteria bacterium]
MPDYKVAIIGAGFCGTMVAVHLARLAPDMPVALIERNPIPGRGLAYGTTDPDHLLNVRAEQMGAFADDQRHFWHWLEAQPDINLSRQDFAPRMVYGRYLGEILAQARAANPRLSLLTRRIADVRQLQNGFELRSDDGRILTSESIVLALGNFPPDQLSGNADEMNPYAPETWKDLAGHGDILIVGTGLTSLDLVVTMAKTKQTGKIHLLSRHGLLPREHTNPESHILKMRPPYPATALGLCKWIRQEIADAPDTPWQAVIDSLRPLNQQLWQSLNRDEQRRFMRHLRAYWDVHRHRCAPKIMDAYRGLEQAGRLALHHGTIIKQTTHEKGVDVLWRPRGSMSPETLAVQKIVRCTGPQADFRRLGDPLVQNLLKANLITADDLRLGIESEDYTACNAAGHKVDGLYVLGSLLKGKLYESIAVPELREQAADVARIITKEKNGCARPAPSAAKTSDYR